MNASSLIELVFIVQVEIDAGVGPEFVSDDFDPSGLNPDDLEREMKQLGMEDGNVGGEVPEWEKELQQELQVGT